jgi:type I restriction-modification system DNA methylase subunit
VNEPELVAELFEEFTSEYEADKVRAEYELSPDSRPDIVVLDDSDEPLFIVEVKARSDKDSQWVSFDQLRRYKSQSTASYLGFFTKNIRYVYQQKDIDGSTIQISSTAFPDSTTDLESQRGFKSLTELQFCYEQAKRICKKESAVDLSIEDFLQAIQQKIIAEEHNIEISAWKRSFKEQLESANGILQQRFPFYESISERDLERSRIVHGVLNGYCFEDTEDVVLEEFVDQIPSFFDDQSTYGTPIASARYIADFLQVSSEDRVLDPAMGWGNVLRELNKLEPEAEYQGIEINPEIAQTASALNTIAGSDISIRVDDGIKLPWRNEEFQSTFDHIVLDPPIGKRVSSDNLPGELKEWEGKFIEDIFVYASLQYLEDGGLLTAIIPVGLLSRNNSKKVREHLIENYQIETIIEVDKGSFYPSVRSDLAAIQVRKQERGDANPTQFVILDRLKKSDAESFEPEIQNQFELNISDIPRNTLIPSNVVAQQNVETSLKQNYPKFQSLDTIASDFRRGIRFPSEKLISEGSLQYLKISDVTGESDSPRFIKEDQVENIVTAGPTDLLISAAGTVDVAYVPDEEVVPHSNWVIVRFSSEALARVYQGFFSTKIGTDYLKSLATGTTIPHLSISVLDDIQVPDFESFLSLEDAVAELAKIEQLHQGRVDQDTAAQVQEILQGDS